MGVEGWGLGLGFGVSGFVLGIYPFGETSNLGCGVWGVGCGVWGVGCEVWGVGCGVEGVRV